MNHSQLLEAFSLFSQETAQLERTYHSLKEEFHSLKERFDAVLSHLDEGLLFVSPHGIVQLFTAPLALMTGLEPQELLGKSYSAYFSDTLFGFSMQEGLREGRACKKRIALELSTPQASFAVEVAMTSLPEKGILLLVRDMGQVRHLEQAIARNERLKELGQMAATLAHEIRNPLGGIEGFAALLHRDLTQEKERAMAAHIIEGTRLLNRLVTNVLNYARPLEIHFASQDLQQIIDEVVTHMRADPYLAGTLVVANRYPQTLSIDKTLFKLALFNLIKNGLEASPTVTITLHKGGVMIHDEGPGIPPEDREKLFTPFFTTKPQGNGLGLSEAHKIIQAHGGTLELASSSKGTTITIQLPDIHDH